MMVQTLTSFQAAVLVAWWLSRHYPALDLDEAKATDVMDAMKDLELSTCSLAKYISVTMILEFLRGLPYFFHPREARTHNPRCRL